MSKEKRDHLKEIEQNFFDLVDVTSDEMFLKYSDNGGDYTTMPEPTKWDYGSKPEDLEEEILELIEDAIENAKKRDEKSRWYLGVAQGLQAMFALYFKGEVDKLKSLEQEIALIKNPQGTN